MENLAIIGASVSPSLASSIAKKNLSVRVIYRTGNIIILFMLDAMGSSLLSFCPGLLLD